MFTLNKQIEILNQLNSGATPESLGLREGAFSAAKFIGWKGFSTIYGIGVFTQYDCESWRYGYLSDNGVSFYTLLEFQKGVLLKTLKAENAYVRGFRHSRKFLVPLESEQEYV